MRDQFAPRKREDGWHWPEAGQKQRFTLLTLAKMKYFDVVVCMQVMLGTYMCIRKLGENTEKLCVYRTFHFVYLLLS